MSTAYIKTIKPLKFGHRVPQADALAWLKAATAQVVGEDDQMRTVEALYNRIDHGNAIQERTTCLTDYTHQRWDEMSLFRELHDMNSDQFSAPRLEDRMQIYADVSADLATGAFIEDTAPPAYLLGVSCTGYDSPSALQKVVVNKGWQNQSRLLASLMSMVDRARSDRDQLAVCRRRHSRRCQRLSTRRDF